MNIVIAGGTGFLGQALLKRLGEAGHTVTVFSRNAQAPSTFSSGVRIAVWDGTNPGDWEEAVQNSDAVINLAGQSLASGWWTRKRKEALLQSRIKPTRALVEALLRSPRKQRVLINASGVGYYPSSGDRELLEGAAAGQGFMGTMCEAWEREAMRAATIGVRVVVLRMGVVLAVDGGALPKMILPFRLFVGGPLGPGSQYFPWIHRDDVLRVVDFALASESLHGPVNVVAPQSVTMREFCSALGKAIQRPSWIPVPSFGLRVLLGEMSEMLLSSHKTYPRSLKDAGFTFRYPLVGDALASLFR